MVGSFAHRADHLGDEQRAAVRAMQRSPRRRAPGAGRHRSAARRASCAAAGSSGASGTVTAATPSGAANRRRIVGAVRDDEQPAPRRDAGGDARRAAPTDASSMNCASSTTISAASGTSMVEQRLDGHRDALGDEALLEGGRLGRRREAEPHDEAEQGEPRLELGRALVHRGAKPALDGGAGAWRSSSQRAQHERPGGRVGMARARLHALDAERPDTRRLSAQLTQQPGLAESCGAGHDREPARAPRRPESGRRAACRARSRGRRTGRSRPARARRRPRPTSDARMSSALPLAANGSIGVAA